jgi:hypothetical protein
VRVEAIGEQCLKPESIASKAEPISIKTFLKTKREDSEESSGRAAKKGTSKYSLLEVDSRTKNGFKRNATSRTKHHRESENHLNFDTIHSQEDPRKRTSIKSTNILPLDYQEEEGMRKHLTDHGLPPKSKLTIKNIDTFASL